MFPSRAPRLLALAVVSALFLVLLLLPSPRRYITESILRSGGPPPGPPPLKYIPQPTWTPPPVRDPFPALETLATAPAIPSWNVPRKNMFKEYELEFAPPLFIGFTRMWPVLLQAVVSYITAGWPPEQIYVVENTGVQDSNAKGRLTMQNPYFLNHAQLKKLGVNIVRAPVLMNFAQLQNFYTHLALENDWPYYFWSHMDVLALSFEDGFEGLTPRAGEDGYKTLYELCLRTLRDMMHSEERWADKFFAYDQLTLVNREAYMDVGGWDTFIPYYMDDCDMHSRLMMSGWTQTDALAGIVTDVGSVLDDLMILYRNTSLPITFTDPNPPPPAKDGKKGKRETAHEQNGKRGEPLSAENFQKREADASNDAGTFSEKHRDYFNDLREMANNMFHYKHGARGRNTWQTGQLGGGGEPYYYPSRGIAEAMDVLTEAGREVFRRKWGHRDCDLMTGTRLKVEDQWLVAKDWK